MNSNDQGGWTERIPWVLTDYPSIIAIDGPAASGKSTLAERLARRLDFLYFDTGVMYRAVTWLALDQGISVDDERAVTRLSQKAQIDVQPPSRKDGRVYDVLVDGEDITWEIRRPEVDANVSVVSAFRGVREAMTTQQRRIGQRGQVVMVGRDIGTVVLPDADLKIYLDASVEERAHRRWKERLALGEDASFEAILEAMRRRDQIDSTRDVAPLRPAEDAVIIESDTLSIEKVLEATLDLVRSKSQ
ncbi:MAG: (d)CMP kinase [Chloroflexi bacterium]|nr:(d)CMP kinase [Chloroflexota bacterium]